MADPPWQEYLEALRAELSAYRQHPFSGRPLATLFFGGGTPSLLPPEFFLELIPEIFEQFPPLPDLEATIECNPGTVTLPGLERYRAAGLNRISFGVQSFDPAHLRTLTRIHSPKESLEAVNMALEAGFDNLSIDLMFGVPGQDPDRWEQELLRALALPLSHLSVYNLTPEEGTALARQLELGRLELPDEQRIVAMYRLTRALLRARGWIPYEISNFTRGRPCRHNLRYWTGDDYLGIGAGAHSFSRAGGAPVVGEGLPDCGPGGCRWSTPPRIDDYLRALQCGTVPVAGVERLSLRDAVTEVLLTRIRLMAGLDLSDLAEQFGDRVRLAVATRAEPFVRRRLMAWHRDRIALTDDGVLVADSVIVALSLAADEAIGRG